jgi:nicotinate-nucleotide adenylyltransferase
MLDPTRCRRLVIYGGSFDPPHRAHMELPFDAAKQIGADGVMFVPTGSPPHKPGPIAPGEHRVNMLRAALGDRKAAAISTFEIDREYKASYTVDTLDHFRAELGEAVELRLLIGADMAAMFYQWRQPRRIIELAEPVVMMRPPLDVEALLAELPDELSDAERAAWRGRVIACPQIDVASTALRERLAAGEYESEDVRSQLPGPVLEYIRREGLYRVP